MKGLSLRGWTIALTAALFLVLTLSLTASASGGTWVMPSLTTPFTFSRFDGQTMGSSVYFLGGRDASNNTDGTVWKLDLSTKTFSMTGSTMTVPISNYQIAALKVGAKTLLYTFGGRDNAGNIVTDVQYYDPSTNSVGEDTADPWPGQTPSVCVSLPGMGVAVANNKAYVFGGASFASSGCVDDNSAQIWIYDPSKAAGARWTKSAATLTVARGYITPLSAKGKILAIGGDINSAGSLIAQTTVEIYDTATDTISAPPTWQLPEACDESQAFLFQNMAVLAGCGQWPAALADTWLHAATGTWTAGSPLNVARRNQAGFTAGAASIPVVVGGYASDGFTNLNSIEYDPNPLLPGAPTGRHPVVSPAGVSNN